ncbi:MAG: hypothetical protein JEZ11_08300 [Desulfobacterales bacterium]|nr:hypothetical protein [Desulfobacterales bacterium]
MKRWTLLFFFIIVITGTGTPALAAFDHSHAPWTELLQRHVRWLEGGTASVVDYAGFQKSRKGLDAYLESLSAVGENEFNNAETVLLRLRPHPDRESRPSDND